MTAPTSRQLRLAMALSRPELIGSQARAIVDLIAAETIDLEPTGELGLAISHGSIGTRLCLSRATVAKHLRRLIDLRLIRWFNPPSGRPGRQPRWVRIEGRFERWDERVWRIDRSKALLALSDAGCDRLYGRSLRKISDRPFGWSQADGDPPDSLEVRTLRGDFVAASMGAITEGRVVSVSRGRSLRAPAVAPSPLTRRSKDLLTPEEEEGISKNGVEQPTEIAQAVLDAVAEVFGQHLVDTHADNPKSRVIRACGSLLNAGPAVAVIRGKKMSDFGGERHYKELTAFAVRTVLAAKAAEQQAIAEAVERRKAAEERAAAEEHRSGLSPEDRAARFDEARAAMRRRRGSPVGHNGADDEQEAL